MFIVLNKSKKNTFLVAQFVEEKPQKKAPSEAVLGTEHEEMKISWFVLRH